VRSHPWLKNFDWYTLIEEKMVAPFVPEEADNFDEQHANHERTLGATEQEELYNKRTMLRRDSIQDLFKGYYFNYHQELLEKEKQDQLGSS
jgi:hypothetical protein